MGKENTSVVKEKNKVKENFSNAQIGQQNKTNKKKKYLFIS